jgi:hypothetical protein
MSKNLPVFIVCLLLTLSSFSQQLRTIKGAITDTAGIPLNDVNIKIVSGKDSLSTTTSNGSFRFANTTFSNFTLHASIIGYKTYINPYSVNGGSNATFDIGTIRLQIQDNRLADVVVVASNPITVKEDTIEYKANAFKVREGAPVEDVIKKLPGVTVDKDGNVTAQGKQVARVRVNGKDYFGGDVQTATQNLPADIIENIQIIDDYGDRANITGVKDGDPEKVLNINIQKGKSKGNFGNATAGVGTQDRYVGQIAANHFNEDQQISMLGAINNTNANLFNFNGGGRGGGARGANFGSGERGGGGDGITLSKSLGLNFRDKWGKKVSSYGSYSYSGRTNNVIGTSFQQDFNPRNINTTSRSSSANTNSSNQRFTWNIEYNMDTSNYFKITPYFSYASSFGNNKSISELRKPGYYTLNNSISSSNSSTPAGGSQFLFNHKFNKRGRNFSLSSSIDYSSRDNDRNATNTYNDVDSTFPNLLITDSSRIQFVNTESRNTTSNVRASYAEPISKATAIEVSYAWNNSSTKSIKEVDDIDPLLGGKTRNMRQSNDYNYTFITNRYGLSLRTFKTKYNYSVGIVAQPSNLTGTDLGRKTTTDNKNFNISPSARFVYNFAKSNSLTMTFGGSSREPNFTQLQPITDSTNIRNIVIGNPNLKAEFTNRMSVQYNKVGILTGNSLFANFSYDQTQNRIVSARFNDPNGTSRTTTYLNTDGFYGFNGNFAYTKPFAKRKYTATVSTSGSFDNNISYTDNYRNNGQNWVVRPGVRFRMDLENIIDVDINSSYSINKTVTRYIDTTIATQAKTLTVGLNGKNYFFKNYTLGYDLTKIINKGYLNTRNANPTLLNMYLERRFLKNNMATVRLQGFDLFNQNTGISREVNGTTVTDVQNNRLGRYFLLTFNFRLQKFAGRSAQGNTDGGQRRGRGDGGGGFGPGGGGRNN